MKKQIESCIVVIILLVVPSISLLNPNVYLHGRIPTSLSSASERADSTRRQSFSTSQKKNTLMPCLILIGSLLSNTMDNGLVSNRAYGYGSDYASETVVNAIKSLKETSGDEVASFKSLENIGDIITEGKGVGGSVSYCKLLFLLNDLFVSYNSF